MAHDYIGKINTSQETLGGQEVSGPAPPVVRGDPALSRLQRLSQGAELSKALTDGAHLSSELHDLGEMEAPQLTKRELWSSPRVVRSLAIGGMLAGCVAGAFALGGAGFFLALAAEAVAFAGGLMMAKGNTSELEKENERLRHLATRDPLMGINNRSSIDEILEEQLLKVPFRRSAVSVIMGDVDHFKSVNDTYGHQVGDEVLIEVSERIKAGMRSEDSVGRYGGEEFLMVLPGIGGTQAVLIAHRIRLQIAQEPFQTNAGALTVTMSLGVSYTEFPELVGAENLVRAADEALYRAKNEGRNRVVLQLLEETSDVTN